MSFAYAHRGVTPDMHIFQTHASTGPRTQSYDRAMDTWTNRGNAGVQMDRGLNAAAVGGRVYATGGSYESSPSTFTVYATSRIYNADAGTWSTTVTNNPTQRDGAVCPVLGASVLHCGGTASTFTSSGDRGATTTQEFFLGAYTSRAAFTGKRTEAGWGESVVSEYLAARYGVIIGGYERTTGVEGFLDSVYMWDITANTWASQQAMVTARYAGGSFTIENETYVVGGAVASLDSDNVDTVESWNRTRNTWLTRENIPGANRRSVGCGVINGKGYAAGGTADGTGQTNYALNYEYDAFEDTWATLQTYNTPAAVVMRGAAA